MVARRRGLFLCLILIGIISLGFPHDASSMQLLKKEISVGRAKISAGVAGSAGYASNVDFKSKDEKGSFVASVTPSVGVKVPLGKTYLETGTGATYTFLDRGDETWGGQADGITRYDLNEKTSIGLGHTFSVNDLYGLPTGNIAMRNKSSAMIKHDVTPRSTITLDGHWENYDTRLKEGRSGDLMEYNEYGGGLGIDFQFSPLTTISLAGNGEYRKFDNAEDKDYWGPGGSIGISQKITPRITVGGKGGYEYRFYRKEGSNIDKVTFGSTVDVILSPFSTLNIAYDRSLQDTFYPVNEEALTDTFALDDGRLNILNENYRTVTTDRVGFSVNYRLTDKDTVELGGAYMRSESARLLETKVTSDLRKELKEDNFYAGVGYNRSITSWCGIGAKGTYGVRQSNVRDKYHYWTATGGLNISF